jgi:hypothetical protein
MTHSSGRFDRNLLDAALRTDFAAFIEAAFHLLNPGTDYAPNWHVDAIAHHLELVRLGKVRRLIITMPPQPEIAFGVDRVSCFHSRTRSDPQRHWRHIFIRSLEQAQQGVPLAHSLGILSKAVSSHAHRRQKGFGIRSCVNRQGWPPVHIGWRHTDRPRRRLHHPG